MTSYAVNRPSNFCSRTHRLASHDTSQTTDDRQTDKYSISIIIMRDRKYGRRRSAKNRMIGVSGLVMYKFDMFCRFDW